MKSLLLLGILTCVFQVFGMTVTGEGDRLFGGDIILAAMGAEEDATGISESSFDATPKGIAASAGAGDWSNGSSFEATLPLPGLTSQPPTGPSTATNTPAAATCTASPTIRPSTTAVPPTAPTSTRAPNSPTASATGTPQATSSPTRSPTAMMTLTHTPSGTPSRTPTAVLTATTTMAPTNAPTLTPTHSAMPSRTATPTPSPQPATHTPTRTEPPEPTGTETPEPCMIQVITNQSIYYPGDLLTATLSVRNMSSQSLEAQTYVILDLSEIGFYPSYFFWPTWGPLPDYVLKTYDPDYEYVYPVFSMIWPSRPPAALNIEGRFWAGMTDPESNILISNISNATFDYRRSSKPTR